MSPNYPGTQGRAHTRDSLITSCGVPRKGVVYLHAKDRQSVRAQAVHARIEPG